MTVRDSAGVEIVENAGDVWSAPEVWRLSAEPLMRMGAVEGEAPYLFDRVVGVVQLSDGRLVVANGRDNTIRWFDATGRFLFQRGGAGEGPGEFSRLGGLVLGAGDTVIAADAPAGRFTKFAANGSLGASIRIAGSSVPPGVVVRTQPGAAYPLADGSYIMAGSGSAGQLEVSEPRLVRLPTPLLRLAADGSHADTIGMFAGAEMEVGPGSIRPARIAKALTYVLGPDGIYVGTQVRFTIDVYSPDGRLRRSIRAPDVDLTVNVAARKDSMRALTSVPPELRAVWERQLDEIVWPETWPAFASFLMATDGNLWVERRPSDISRPDYQSFAVFDQAGALVTAVKVPASFIPMTVTADRVIGRETDDMGVQYVAVYAIERG